jgi:WD40 repeat protein
LRHNRKPVWAVAFSPDGARAISGGHAEVIKVWDLETGKDVTP